MCIRKELGLQNWNGLSTELPANRGVMIVNLLPADEENTDARLVAMGAELADDEVRELQEA